MVLEKGSVVAVKTVDDWSGLVQRAMIALEVASGFMPADETVQAVMQNGRLALQELGDGLCRSPAQREGYDEDITGEQRQAAGVGRRRRVGNQEL